MSVKRGILRLKLHLSYINLPFILRVSIVYLTCILRGELEGERKREGGEMEEKWRRKVIFFIFICINEKKAVLLRRNLRRCAPMRCVCIDYSERKQGIYCARLDGI